jgi:hypothetical protein
VNLDNTFGNDREERESSILDSKQDFVEKLPNLPVFTAEF